MSDTPRPRALLSVADKRGLTELARELADRGFELVSTGGTARAIREAGIAVTDVADVTGAPEMLDGRVKTLHPRIHAGVLADLHDPSHRAQLAEQGIEPFSLVVVNLYRFEEAAAAGSSEDEIIEEIDIGGPTLVRAAAKNHASVAIVCDPDDYPVVLAQLDEHGHVPLEMRRTLALKAFRAHGGLRRRHQQRACGTLDTRRHAARHAPAGPAPDAATALRREPAPAGGALRHRRRRPCWRPLRRGCRTPPGKAPLVQQPARCGGRRGRGPRPAWTCRGHREARQSLWRCGGRGLVTAWTRALEADPVSAFGGVVAVRGTVDAALADELTSLFLEVVVAEGYDARARDILAAKPDLRLLLDPTITRPTRASLEARAAGGGLLLSVSDVLPDDPAAWRTVSQRRARSA